MDLYDSLNMVDKVNERLPFYITSKNEIKISKETFKVTRSLIENNLNKSIVQSIYNTCIKYFDKNIVDLVGGNRICIEADTNIYERTIFGNPRYYPLRCYVAVWDLTQIIYTITDFSVTPYVEYRVDIDGIGVVLESVKDKIPKEFAEGLSEIYNMVKSFNQMLKLYNIASIK